jgi:hypothetical protein
MAAAQSGMFNCGAVDSYRRQRNGASAATRNAAAEAGGAGREIDGKAH